jgi:hypothetical protein
MVSMVFLFEFITTLVPVLGAIVSGVLTPALQLGLMSIIAVRTVPTQDTPIRQLLVVFREPAVLKVMLRLGTTYMIIMSLTIFIFGMFFGVDVPIKETANLHTNLANPLVQEAIFKNMLRIIPMLLPVVLVFWFTQQLVGWHGQSVPKALFFSTLACWRNKTAFIVYIITWVFIAIITVVLFSVLINFFKGLDVILMPVSMLLLSWITCSIYASYESSIHILD